MTAYSRASTVVGLIATSVALLGLLSLFYPTSIQAFWPFSSAQAADGETPVLHDPSTRLLAAALNLDPNPSKGDGDLSLSEGSALMATGGPEGAIPQEPTTSAPSSGSISVYTVKNGDSISGIADHFGVSVNTILWANDLTIRSTIRPGMDLVILPVSGAKHTVKSGETLSSIASAYDASAGEIATFNGLDEDATVVVGSSLIIPGGEVHSAAPKAVATKKTTASVKTSTAVSTPKTTSSDAGSSSSTSGGFFQNPLPGAILTQSIHGNNGVDLGAPSGTPILAAAAGTVIISKNDAGWNGGYGSYVVVSHSNGTQTLYSHMSKDIVSVGDSVSQGEVIGYVGNTGSATGYHLHFEVRGAKNSIGYSCTLMKKCY
jgi:LysM repeat protein